MIWKENGVERDSYMCFFNPSESVKEHLVYMYSCGYFHTNSNYHFESNEYRPHLFFYIKSGSLNIETSGSLNSKNSRNLNGEISKSLNDENSRNLNGEINRSLNDETSGNLSVENSSQTYTATSGQIVLLDCHKASKYYCENTCEFLFFHFDGNQATEILQFLLKKNGSPIFSIANHETIYQKINEPILELCYQEQTSDMQLSSIVYSVLCLMAENQSAKSSALSDKNNDSTLKVIDYIKSHIHEMPRLDELAAIAGLSPYHFSRVFKQDTGISPIEYVAVTKINYAKMMLRTTNASISDIAETLGYSSSSSFINAFKSRRGISPLQYRQQ